MLSRLKLTNNIENGQYRLRLQTREKANFVETFIAILTIPRLYHMRTCGGDTSLWFPSSVQPREGQKETLTRD
jgi:hypothetical protein